MNARKIRKIAVSLASALIASGTVIGMTGCVAEDLDDCPAALRLTFRYTHNTTRKDLFAGNVRSVDVYVFDDRTGVLTEIIELSPDDISRSRRDIAFMAEGVYTLVAWGGSGEEMTRSYAGRHMLDGAYHNHTDVEIGVTTLDDLYMMLGYDNAPADIEGDIVPATPDFDDLFWAMAEGVEIVEGGSRSVDFDLIRNTSLLRVAVTGLEHFEDPADTRAAADRLPLRLFATGSNGRYRYDNTIDPHARTVHYTAFDHRRTRDGMSLNIPMQRLHIGRHEDDPVLLHIEQYSGPSATASIPIPGILPIDLVSAIRESTDGMGNNPYGTQESIDREHEFRIALAISPDPDHPGSFRLTMTINEWDVIIIVPIVDQPD